MDESFLPGPPGLGVWALNGTLREYSTEQEHAHPCHQLLAIRNGVSLLVDELHQQPLYGSMCAFIPAGCAHRSTVVGGPITYQSLYFFEDPPGTPQTGISIFPMGRLGTALFLRLQERQFQDLSDGLPGDCFHLLLRVLTEDLASAKTGIHLPVLKGPETRSIALFIAANYARPLRPAHFARLLACSERHAARIFKQDAGITIFEYLRIYRMFQASVLLHGKARSITNVATTCGYESLSSFYADFARYFSMTPRALRQVMAP
jgi:AraC-like DNA-binding protein